MGTMPVGRLIITMSLPMVASMMFQAVYNIVDSIFVAKLNQDAMNAVSLAFPFQSLVIAFAAGTGVGMNALLSRSLGEKDFEGADRAANTGIFLYICSAIVFSILGFLTAEPYFRILTDNARIIGYGKAYLTVCIGFCYAIFGQMCSERLLQSTGRTDLAMIPQIAGAVFNMIFDPILIFGLLGFPRLEVLGAAIATASGQVLATIIGFTLNVKKNREIHLSLKKVRFHRETSRNIYRIALPSIVLQAVGSFTNFIINNILISFTEAATAAYGAYFKIQSFVFLPVIGLNNALVPIVSYNHGAKRSDRVKKAVKLGVLIAVGIMVFGTLCFELIPKTLLGWFSPTEEMLRVGTVAFRIIGTHFPVAGFCIVAGSVCQALGKPVYSLITSLCRQVVVLLPVLYLLSLTGNLDLVWLAFPIAEVMSLIMSSIFLKKTMKLLHY